MTGPVRLPEKGGGLIPKALAVLGIDNSNGMFRYVWNVMDSKFMESHEMYGSFRSDFNVSWLVFENISLRALPVLQRPDVVGRWGSMIPMSICDQCGL